MKWLKNKVIKWIREDYYNASEAGVKGIVRSSDYDNKPEEDPVMTFRIYSAVNGQILEFRRYDRKNDRSNNSVYLIPKDQEIGEYVSKCLNMEMLK